MDSFLVLTITPSITSIFLPFTFGLGVSLLLMFILVSLSAIISGSEVAYFSLNLSDKINLKDESSSNSVRVLLLLSKPKKLLATILIFNNLINVAIVMISNFVMNRLIDSSKIDSLYQFLIQVIGVTLIILLFGEVIPKIYANKYNMKYAKIMSLPISFISILLSPFSNLLMRSTSIIDKKIRKKTENISLDELEHALDLTKDSVKSEEEIKMLEGIVKFGNTDVKQVMTPRMDVFAFEEKSHFHSIMEAIKNAKYSRIPIYEDSLDLIVGILYVKDLLPYISENKEYKWTDLSRKPKFVPENKKLDDLLEEFQAEKTHIAIVVDEYGGTSGIVSLEDVLEEIVGDITDEFDEDEISYSKLDENNYIFAGKTPLIDVYRIIEVEGEDFEDNKGEADTIAGFCIEQAGKILLKNEKVLFNNYTFTIEAADKRRITKIKLTINDED